TKVRRDAKEMRHDQGKMIVAKSGGKRRPVEASGDAVQVECFSCQAGGTHRVEHIGAIEAADKNGAPVLLRDALHPREKCVQSRPAGRRRKNLSASAEILLAA